jgi:hypothetical protein
MKYDTSEVDELISWSEEDDFNAIKAPSKWVLRVEQELRRLREYVNDTEKDNGQIR